MRKRVTKSEWIEAALAVLQDGGAKAIRVEDLARRLNVSKSGFYWHFKDRRDLLMQLLDYWSHEYTEIVSENPDVKKLEPRERLKRTMEMVLDLDLNKFELSMRAWAAHDPQVARRVSLVYRKRFEFIRQAFAELGFEGDELEMRTSTFACCVAWERIVLWRQPKKALRAHFALRLEMLTKK